MLKEQYVRVMHLKDRCVVFTDKNNIMRALATFAITNEPLNKNPWDIPKEAKDGKFVFIDRLITNRKSEIRTNMREMVKYFKNRYPGKKIIWNSRNKGAEQCIN